MRWLSFCASLETESAEGRWPLTATRSSGSGLSAGGRPAPAASPQRELIFIALATPRGLRKDFLQPRSRAAPNRHPRLHGRRNPRRGKREEWLGRTLERLQDRAYIAVMARQLIDESTPLPAVDGIPQLTTAALRQFWQTLEVTPGRRSERSARRTHGHSDPPRRARDEIPYESHHQLEGRNRRRPVDLTQAHDKVEARRRAFGTPQPPPPSRRYRVGVIIEVDDWEASLHFYRDVLQLDISKQSPR